MGGGTPLPETKSWCRLLVHCSESPRVVVDASIYRYPSVKHLRLRQSPRHNHRCLKEPCSLLHFQPPPRLSHGGRFIRGALDLVIAVSAVEDWRNGVAARGRKPAARTGPFCWLGAGDAGRTASLTAQVPHPATLCPAVRPPRTRSRHRSPLREILPRLPQLVPP